MKVEFEVLETYEIDGIGVVLALALFKKPYQLLSIEAATGGVINISDPRIAKDLGEHLIEAAKKLSEVVDG